MEGLIETIRCGQGTEKPLQTVQSLRSEGTGEEVTAGIQNKKVLKRIT